MATNFPTLSSLEDFLKQEYDFVVVGGGTAGLVVAARLTENPNVTVGVLEAGPSHFGDPLVLTPAAYVKAIGDPKYDWRHKTTPQIHSSGKSVDWARGKGLGGSSAINYQMYNRGQSVEYDDWAALGNLGWDFKSMLPYFRKHETFDDPKFSSQTSNLPLLTKYDLGFHGNLGPIHTSFSTWRMNLEEAWIKAASSFGETWGSPMDGWSGDHLGSFHGLSTIDRSPGPGFNTRSYSTTGYLLPNIQRPNLHVLTEALVTRLIPISLDGVVSGVEFRHGGKEYAVKVKKEVVLSAGVVKSPQILELSGIGNPEILSKAGVKCLIRNDRIGEHLQDHCATGLVYELADGETSMDIFQDENEAAKAMQMYIEEKTGPMSTGGSAHCFASFASLSSPDEISEIQNSILGPKGKKSNLPDDAKKLLAEGLSSPGDASLQIVLLPASVNMEGLHDQQLFMKPGPDMVGKMGVSLGGCVARPLSAGSIHITSSDPTQDPEIDPTYHAHPADVLLLAKSIELMERMAATSPFKEKIKKRTFPPPEVNLKDRKGREEYVRGHTGTEYHPIGSLAMGKEGEGAVDERLVLRGCRGVRVVDASVMPLHVGGNIVGTVYAVAEKGSYDEKTPVIVAQLGNKEAGELFGVSKIKNGNRYETVHLAQMLKYPLAATSYKETNERSL
ncbi:hypothetical protein G7Y89_g2262 [Cudoniella acicularis]|uniref:Glucose-methanol-choline oxidoreductase N-terminal domain-containing protein n=1 Tax=Cudoniella acicularis TaxID=354080 RepID=A0A8H4RUR4_9HELO|nr:hypothetical protein G7Y89_g2262 [Cudoniella acicularis]